jgi:transcriptional regulator with XRE-family HTH domain
VIFETWTTPTGIKRRVPDHQALHALRERAGLTQTDLAKRIATSQRMVSAIEAGESACPLDTAVAWETVCKVALCA